MKITESQLQVLALAEEVERLQSLLAAERAARDELRRHALKLSAPRPPPLAAADIDTADRPSAVSRADDAPPPGEPQLEALQPTTARDRSAVETGERQEHVSVVHRAQHAEQVLPVKSAQRAAGRQRRSGFSIWGFITGEDRIRA